MIVKGEQTYKVNPAGKNHQRNEDEDEEKQETRRQFRSVFHWFPETNEHRGFLKIPTPQPHHHLLHMCVHDTHTHTQRALISDCLRNTAKAKKFFDKPIKTI